MPRHAASARARRTTTAGVTTALAVTVWVIAYRSLWGQHHLNGLLVVYLAVAGVLVASMWASARGRRLPSRPARGRVVAIVPTFNENPAALHATVEALLSGTVVPDEIHVVDDGSDEPAPPYPHPRVHPHRQRNGGKREAQALVLRQLDPAATDFILTVDSDSVVDRFALQRLLHAMADERVHAATGLPLVRNRAQNLVTRLTDLEMVSACLTMRSARSELGAVAPCSGALSLYRAGVVLDNIDDYVTSGTAGDDRRLTHYALLRGHAVAIDDAYVHTDMPHRIRGVYKQRLRWFCSYWRYAPWEVANLPLGPVLWRGYNLVLSVVVPLALLWIAVSALLGHGLMWRGLLYWLGILWFSTLRYATSRPGVSRQDRLLTWLLGTPLLVVAQLFLLRPSMIHALFKARTSAWGTRAAKPANAARGRGRTRAQARLQPQGRYRGARIHILADA